MSRTTHVVPPDTYYPAPLDVVCAHSHKHNRKIATRHGLGLIRLFLFTLYSIKPLTQPGLGLLLLLLTSTSIIKQASGCYIILYYIILYYIILYYIILYFNSPRRIKSKQFLQFIFFHSPHRPKPKDFLQFILMIFLL